MVTKPKQSSKNIVSAKIFYETLVKINFVACTLQEEGVLRDQSAQPAFTCSKLTIETL